MDERAVSRLGRRLRRAGASVASAARDADRNPSVVRAVRRVRGWLPGDSRFGDPLSTAGDRQVAIAARRLAELSQDRPGALREVGFGALQVWQAVLEASGRGTGEREVTVVFTDLVGFSSWALGAGDDETLRLLRAVGEAVEPAVTGHGGEVVKRLGDGMMATFADAQAGLDAVLEARDRLADVEAPGYRPRLRAAMHTGHPRRLGGDYLGVDVNVAARLAEKAAADELLVSETTLQMLDHERIRYRRKKTFVFRRVKGVPSEMAVYAVTPRTPE